MQALATITRRVKTTFSSSAKDEPLLLGAIAKQRTDLDTVCDVADYLQKLIDEDLLEVTASRGFPTSWKCDEASKTFEHNEIRKCLKMLKGKGFESSWGVYTGGRALPDSYDHTAYTARYQQHESTLVCVSEGQSSVSQGYVTDDQVHVAREKEKKELVDLCKVLASFSRDFQEVEAENNEVEDEAGEVAHLDPDFALQDEAAIMPLQF